MSTLVDNDVAAARRTLIKELASRGWLHEREGLLMARNERVSRLDSEIERSIRTRAYFIWEREGRPEGCALAHWQQAARIVCRENNIAGHMLEEEKLLAGRQDVNFPALLTKDVKGG